MTMQYRVFPNISSLPSIVIMSSRNKITSSFRLDCIVFAKTVTLRENGLEVKRFHDYKFDNEC